MRNCSLGRWHTERATVILRCWISALEDYQSTRDRLSMPLFDIVDRIASQQWTDEEIARLQRQLSSAMADEVEALTALEPGALT